MKMIRNILISLIAGGLIGIIAAYGDTLRSDGQIDVVLIIANYFNTPTLWAMSAFFIGTISKSKLSAMGLGTLLLLSAVDSYYLYGITFGNRTEIMMETIVKAVLVWSVLALLIGPIYALAGSIWRHTQSINKRMFALIFLPVLIISENAYYLFLSRNNFLENISVNVVYIGMILVGLSLPFILLRDVRRGLLASTLSVIASVLGIAFLYFLFGYIRGMGI